MAVKIKNHTVTKGYLKGWRSENSKGEVGIWYFDFNTRSVEFSLSLNASFAIDKGLYVPKARGERRDDRLENWFSKTESEMCDFVREHIGGRPSRWKPTAILRALSGIISHGYRSSYSVEGLKAHTRTLNPSLDEIEIHKIALNHIYNTAIDRTKFFSKGTAIIFELENPILRTNDSPFWDMTPQSQDRPLAVFPLSPSRLMTFNPSVRPAVGDLQIITKRGSDSDVAGIIEFSLHAAMRMSRGWVVCPTEADAYAVKSYLDEKTIAEVKATDVIRLIETTEFNNLYA